MSDQPICQRCDRWLFRAWFFLMPPLLFLVGLVLTPGPVFKPWLWGTRLTYEQQLALIPGNREELIEIMAERTPPEEAMHILVYRHPEKDPRKESP